MDFTFTILSDIPKDGTLTVTFVNLSTMNFPDDASTQCIVDKGTCVATDNGNTLGITFGDEGGFAAGSVTATIYAKFTSDTASALIEGRDSSGRFIGRAKSSQQVAMGDPSSSTEKAATFFNVATYDDHNAGTVLKTAGTGVSLNFYVDAGDVALTAGASLLFNCPINNTQMDDFKFYISDTNTSWKNANIADSNTNSILTDETPNADTNGVLATVEVETDSLKIAEGGLDGTANTEAYVLAGCLLYTSDAADE